MKAQFLLLEDTELARRNEQARARAVAKSNALRSDANAIDDLLRERKQLIRALRPFAELFAELPRPIQNAAAQVRTGYGATPIVAVIGQKTLTAAQILEAMRVYVHSVGLEQGVIPSDDAGEAAQ